MMFCQCFQYNRATKTKRYFLCSVAAHDSGYTRCRVRQGKQKAGQLDERLHGAVFRICSKAGTRKDALPRFIGGKHLFGQKKVPPRGVEPRFSD
jgi:hypothetical protein